MPTLITFIFILFYVGIFLPIIFLLTVFFYNLGVLLHQFYYNLQGKLWF
jgi:hypothetical protein